MHVMYRISPNTKLAYYVMVVLDDIASSTFHFTVADTEIADYTHVAL